MSIGIMAAALGFRCVVHMSRDAKAWKKTMLRGRGVTVVEHDGDFGAAVAAGRTEAETDPRNHFVDDEQSETLFFGYSAAAFHIERQLRMLDLAVDAAHPLFVYLPCGVGGAPGGITFGLRQLFGDHVHCFVAEPVAAPAMILRLSDRRDLPVSVRQIGLDVLTEADGLAVGQVSEFAARQLRHLLSGGFTVTDDELLRQLFLVEREEGMRIEPSAAAGFGGPAFLEMSEPGQRYLGERGLRTSIRNATHIVWTTGGAFVPEDEYAALRERGRQVAARSGRSADAADAG